MMKKFLISLFITCFLIIPCFVLAEETAAAAEPLTEEAPEFINSQGDMLVTENERFALYLNYEKGETLQFYVVDKESGVLYRSSPEKWSTSSDRKKRMQTGSQLLVNSLDKVTKTAYSANSQVSSVGEEGTVVTFIENGFRVDYDFPRKKDLYKIPILYILEEDGLRVEIVTNEIEEYGDVFVQSIAVLPNFFGADGSEPGYLLIPDGCGSLIDFNAYRKGMTGYRQTLYGRDPALTSIQQIGQSMTPSLPILGLQNGDAGMLLIAEKGSALAAACAYPAGSDTVYSSVYFEFTYRGVDKMMLADKTWYQTDVEMVNRKPNDHQNFSVLYRFCSGDESGYVGMANIYRDYLISQGMKKSATETPSIHLDVYMGIKKLRSVMGIMVVDLLKMTTFSQAEQMLLELSNNGIDDIHMTLLGWNKGGLQDGVQSKSNPEGKLGGASGLKQLNKTAEQLNAQVLCDTDLMRFYETDISHNALNGSVHKVTGDPAEQRTFRVSTYQKNTTIDPHYLLQPKQLTDNARKFSQSLNMKAQSFSTLGKLVYSDYNYNEFSSRENTLNIVQQILAQLQDELDIVAVSYGNGYALPYTDVIYDTPLFDSGYDISTTDVPFVSILLHGYQTMYSPAYNQSEDQETLLLRLIETGVHPTFSLTWLSPAEMRDTQYEHLLSTEYAMQKDHILAVYQTWQQASQDLNGLQITDHKIQGEVRCTTYEDGTCVYVNYGWDDAQMDGVTVPARDWMLKKGGA